MGNKYSIIVPIYKVEKYIEQCIHSIQNQTYGNFEAILVVDGSPDSCLEICKAFANQDERLIVINKENGGLVSARKAGAQIATGEYIICLDGDDWIADNYLEIIDKSLSEKVVDVLCCGYYIAYEDKCYPRPMKERYGYYSESDIKNEILPHLIEAPDTSVFLNNIWAKVYKREKYIIHQLKIDDVIKMGEDGACTIPIISSAKSMTIIPECLYFYRQNNSSMTKEKKRLPWESYIAITELFLECLDTNSDIIKEQLNRRIVHSFFTVAKSQFYEKGNYKNIKAEIISRMNEPNVLKAVGRCRFSISLKTVFIQLTIKYRMIWLLKLLSRIW